MKGTLSSGLTTFIFFNKIVIFFQFLNPTLNSTISEKENFFPRVYLDRPTNSKSRVKTLHFSKLRMPAVNMMVCGRQQQVGNDNLC